MSVLHKHNDLALLIKNGYFFYVNMFMTLASCVSDIAENKYTLPAYAGYVNFSLMIATLIIRMNHQRQHFIVYTGIYIFLVINCLIIKSR